MTEKEIWEPPKNINKVKRISDGEIGYQVYTHSEKKAYTVVWIKLGTASVESIFDVELIPDEIPSVARKPKRDFF